MHTVTYLYLKFRLKYYKYLFVLTFFMIFFFFENHFLLVMSPLTIFLTFDYFFKFFVAPSKMRRFFKFF